MQVSEVKAKIQSGDYSQVARAVNCSVGMVKSVLSGTRNAETDLGQRIVKAAIILTTAREKAIEAIQTTNA